MLGILLPAAALAACSQPHGDSPQTSKPKPIVVETFVVVQREVPNTLLLAGTLKPHQESDLAADASGRVLQTMVERGSYVSRNQPIAQLDVRIASLSATEARANVEMAQTQKAAAQTECARAEQLFRLNAISQAEYERQTTSCKSADSSTAAAGTRLALARVAQSSGTVRAPFAGLVSERYVSVGEYVMPWSRVAHIIDIETLRLELTIPEQNMSAVREGLKVEFQVAAFPDRTFAGVVHYIGPSVRATTRDLVFEALVPNKDKLLRPGLFATARLEAGTQQLPVVPRSALKQDGDSTRAYVVIGKRVEERLVQLGPVAGEWVAILKGVAPGEQAVMRPTDQVGDGVEVQ